MSAFGVKQTWFLVGWPEYIMIAAGDQLSAVGAETTTGTLSITECPT